MTEYTAASAYRNSNSRASGNKSPEEVAEAIARGRAYIEPMADEERLALQVDLEFIQAEIRQAEAFLRGRSADRFPARRERLSSLKMERARIRRELDVVHAILDMDDSDGLPHNVERTKCGGFRAVVCRKFCGHQATARGPVRKTKQEAADDAVDARRNAKSEARRKWEQAGRKTA